MDCSLPGSSVHGIFQTIVLEWIAISFSSGSSRPRDGTQVSCIVDRHITIWATREVCTFHQMSDPSLYCLNSSLWLHFLSFFLWSISSLMFANTWSFLSLLSFFRTSRAHNFSFNQFEYLAELLKLSTTEHKLVWRQFIMIELWYCFLIIAKMEQTLN